MIPFTYGASGVLLIATAGLFVTGCLDATTQTLAWCAVFFFASAAASSAYLTVSELFPAAMRGMAIAVFYAIATAAGAVAPLVFGWIVEGGERSSLALGYVFASVLMLGAAVIARVFGVAAEGRSLEALTRDDDGVRGE